MTLPRGTTESEDADAGDIGSGGHGLAGYEYQIDASVWLALDLVLANKLAKQITLEPASQEDIEAELSEFEPGRVDGRVALDGYRVLIQAKLRNGDAWTEKRLVKLLTHGGKTRKSAADHLSDPQTRYLLVTSAGLNGGTRSLAVRNAGTWPLAAQIPKSIAEALPDGAADRIAVIGNKTEDLLSAEIQRLLTERFGIPRARWRMCWQTLREQARARIRGAGGGRWTRADLEDTIRAHEGYFASSPELERYVYPSQWDTLLAAMTERHAALIVGQSGTGKTMTTRKLHEALREKFPGLSHVHITQGPHQLANDRTESPVLYDIEDPWGRFDFDRDSRPWNDQLAQLFRHASAERMIVATSRLDVARSSGALSSVEPWVVHLEAEHYGRSARQVLFRSRIEALPRELQPIASRAEKTVLSNLTTPLEIQKFFDALTILERPDTKQEGHFVDLAIKRAHQESIQRTVIEQIGQRDGVRAAAVLWGLLKANGKLSLRGVRALDEELGDRDADLSDAVRQLIDFFIAARNLRETDGVLTYYHPQVEAGIERALLQRPAVVRRTLRSLVEALTAADDEDNHWGAGVGARLILGTDRHPELRPTSAPAAQGKIDAWLDAKTAEAGGELETTLRLAAASGSAESVPSELARYLLHQPDDGLIGLMNWRPPDRSLDWYARMRKHPATKPLLDSFVREVLPRLRVYYPRDFARALTPLAPDLTDAFLAAAKQIVSYGVLPPDDAIAAGALEDLDAFESIVDAAVEVLTPSDEELARLDDEHLAILNGEYSEEYIEHLSLDDSGHTAGELLRSYVDKLRASGAWQPLAEHRHRDRLQSPWLTSIGNDGPETEVDAGELASVFAIVRNGRREADFWAILQQRWHPHFLPLLRDRVRDGHDIPEVRHAALACLVARAPSQLTPVLSTLGADGGDARMAGIALDLCALRGRGAWHDRDEKRHAKDVDAAIDALPPTLQDIANAAIALQNKRPPALSTPALSFLAGISDGDAALRRFRVDLDRHVSLPVDGDIEWLLGRHRADSDTAAADATAAVDAATRRGLIPLVEAALQHRYARAAACALTALATPLEAPLPATLLDSVDTKGSPVRQALVTALEAKPHLGHLPTLLRLVRDTWSSNMSYYGEDCQYPIARSAASAIDRLDELPADVAAQLHEAALGTSDQFLRHTLFEINARRGDDAARERLVEIATAPGRATLQSSAAHALLQAHAQFPLSLTQHITAQVLASRPASVAAKLALLLAVRSQPATVLSVAKELAAHARRRALLLLLAWPLLDRDVSAARSICDLLPPGHVAAAKVMGQHGNALDDAALADLGDPTVTAEVLRYIGEQAHVAQTPAEASSSCFP